MPSVLTGQDLIDNIAYIYTENISRALRVASRIESGTVAINSAFMPNISTAFGGQKQSGNGGHESGKYALHDYLESRRFTSGKFALHESR